MPRGSGRAGAGSRRGGGGSGVSVNIEGLDQFLRDLKRFEPELSKDFRRRLRAIVEEVAKDARSRAPKKSGKLTKGIRPSVTNTGARLLSKAEHARIHEFGGRHPVFGHDRWVYQTATPHIFPAVNAARETVGTEALAALDEAIAQIGFNQ